jgi:hypothetical protein
MSFWMVWPLAYFRVVIEKYKEREKKVNAVRRSLFPE